MATDTTRTDRADPGRRNVGGVSLLVGATLAVAALSCGLIAGPVAAQSGPSATAEAVCFDGAHGIEMTPTDASELYLFDWYIDGELIQPAELTDNDSVLVDGLENGDYEVLVNVYLPGDTPTELLSETVTLNCTDLTDPPPPSSNTTTTTAPTSTTTTSSPAVSPRAAAAGEATLQFTG